VKTRVDVHVTNKLLMESIGFENTRRKCKCCVRFGV